MTSKRRWRTDARNRFVDRKKSDWARELLSVLVVATIGMVGRATLADHYVVPSGSMEPTVEVGDRILVDKRAYGLRLPLSNIYIVEGADPKTGEVVVLDSPETGAVLLKRVVAGPQDTVSISDGRVVLNGVAAPIESSDGALIELLESTAHFVRLTRGGGPEFGPIRLPSKKYLVVGDNRGLSHDGRSFGFVDRETILGRAEIVYFRKGSFTWTDL